MPSPVDIVQSIYAAFGRGDIPAVIEACAPDCIWRMAADERYRDTNPVAFHIPRQGREGVAAFFQAMATAPVKLDLAITSMGQGAHGEVYASTAESWVNPTTGKKADIETVHRWKLDAQGRVVEFMAFVDTHTMVQIWS